MFNITDSIPNVLKSLSQFIEPELSSSIEGFAKPIFDQICTFAAEQPLVTAALVLTSAAVVFYREKSQGLDSNEVTYRVADVQQAKRLLRHHRGSSEVISDSFPEIRLSKEEDIFTCSDDQTRKFHSVFNRIYKLIIAHLPARTHDLAKEMLSDNERRLSSE
ncbi:MAG: hypothetical protein Q8K75_05190 [Chlamydiales bacterium]|nr:hypothetical protein [Chlamydiales bacterium]